MQHHQDSHFKRPYGFGRERALLDLHQSPNHLHLHVNLDDATSANNDCQSVHATIAPKIKVTYIIHKLSYGQ